MSEKIFEIFFYWRFYICFCVRECQKISFQHFLLEILTCKRDSALERFMWVNILLRSYSVIKALNARNAVVSAFNGTWAFTKQCLSHREEKCYLKLIGMLKNVILLKNLRVVSPYSSLSSIDLHFFTEKRCTTSCNVA